MKKPLKKIFGAALCCALVMPMFNVCCADEIKDAIIETEQSGTDTEKTILLSELAESNSVIFELSGTTIN